MKFKKTARQYLGEMWAPTLGFIFASLALFGVYIYRITDLVPGFSVIEKVSIASASSAKIIMNDPLNAPHKVLQYILTRIDHTGFIAMRGVSIVIAIGLVALFFYVIRRWFSFRVAVMATILFATSSWMLNITRLATPDIMVLSIIAAIAYGAWIPRTKKHRLAVALGFGMVVWLLYVPGLVWFVIFGTIWQRKRVIELMKSEQAVFVLIIVGLLALLGPLLFSLYNDPQLLKAYVGLSADPLNQLAGIPKRLLLIPVKLVLYNYPVNPVYGIAKLPLLDIFTVVMALLGAFNFFVNDRLLDRTKIIFGGIMLSCGLYALNGTVGIQILIPFIYLLVAGGIAFMLQQWFKVFPINPFAKTLATGMLLIALIMVSFYHANRYYVAWPSIPATRAAFNQKP